MVKQAHRRARHLGVTLIFWILKLLFWPIVVLRTLYRAPLFITLGVACVLGFIAFEAYEDYKFDVAEARYLARQAPPDAIPLSQLTRRDAARDSTEIAVDGLYFTGLPETTIDPFGIDKGVILLADEQGREIKAVLVVPPAQLPALRRYLTAQGTGDRFRVTVNGFFNSSSEWTGLVDTRLAQLGLPAGGDVVVVEPFVDGRGAGLMARAERALLEPAIFGGLAALFAAMGVLRWLTNAPGTTRAARPRPAPAPQPVTKFTPAAQATPAPAASPWSPGQPAKPAAPTKAPISPAPNPAAARQKPAPKPQADANPPAPEFKSVFPGGGSGFRFKTADEIIRETFGTVSLLNRPPPSSKD